MSKLIERGFLENAHTLVEAGTGVGKSLAYLVPALRSGKKVVVSTATIALQEQLVGKDIPLVLKALGVPARVELLKGRSHYLCRAKLDRLRAERLIAQSATMEKMWAWGDRTQSGDRAELPFAPAPLEWEALDADADDCVGEFCERFRDCFFFARRDAAKYADLVVVNHALFFLDMALGGTLLPPYDYAILDEEPQGGMLMVAAEKGSDDSDRAAGILRLGSVAMPRLRRAVLSACSTARNEDAGNSEPTGLAEQMLRAGTREVVASLWPVDSAATTAFMVEFYKRLGSGVRSDEALSLAARSVRDRAEFSHPYYWASFEVFRRD